MPVVVREFSPGEQMRRLVNIEPTQLLGTESVLGVSEITREEAMALLWQRGVIERAETNLPPETWFEPTVNIPAGISLPPDRSTVPYQQTLAESSPEDDTPQSINYNDVRPIVVAGLRESRRRHEQHIASLLGEYSDTDNVDVEPHLAKPLTPEQLREQFPNGDFLFHGTDIVSAYRILEHGRIIPHAELVARGISKPSESRGGSAGVSFSANSIGQLPGDYGHLVGFMVAPRDVDGKLYLPVEAAPYELQLGNEHFNDDAWRTTYIRDDCWRGAAAEFEHLKSWVLPLAGTAPIEEPLVIRTQRALAMGEETLEQSRAGISEVFDEKTGLIVFDFSNEVFLDENTSYLAPILQKAIDEQVALGLFGREVETIADLKPLELLRLAEITIPASQHPDDIEKAEYGDVMQAAINGKIDLARTYAMNAGVTMESTVFICSDKDFGSWQRILSKFPNGPRGILTYDSKKVTTSNFVIERDQGHQDALTKEIRRQLPIERDSFDWNKLFPNGVLRPTGHNAHMLHPSSALSAKAPRFKD